MAIESYCIDGWHTLIGVQRLAINDLTALGNQPMRSRMDDSSLIYNGEVFNYLQIRKELVSCGHTFKSNCDTEVLLAALSEWGPEKALEKCIGMWAFAWCHPKSNRVVLARDRFGEKPLYYYMKDNVFIWASEIKTILLLANRKFSLNVQAVGEFVLQGFSSTSPQTIFNDIHQLPSGNVCEITLSKSINFNVRPYYQIAPRNLEHLDFDGLTESLQVLLTDAIGIRLRCDVPVGILLSGGIDSSLIAAIANNRLWKGQHLNLISSSCEIPGFDERHYSRSLGEFIGRESTEIEFNLGHENFGKSLEQATWHNDEPVQAISTLMHLQLMKKAKELGIKVVLSGQGADEVFCGYKKYFGFYLQSLIARKECIEACLVMYRLFRQKTVLKQFTFAEAKRYFPRCLRSTNHSIAGPYLESFRPLSIGMGRKESIQCRQKLDIQSLSIPANTHYEDRMAMAVSVENRTPFLDHRVVEFGLGLQADDKLRNGWTKYLLRKVSESYVPKEISWRRDKMGLTNPGGEWLKTELRETVKSYFGDESLMFQKNLVNRKALMEKYKKYCAQPFGKGTISTAEIFNPLSLEVWLRTFQNNIV